MVSAAEGVFVLIDKGSYTADQRPQSPLHSGEMLGEISAQTVKEARDVLFPD